MSNRITEQQAMAQWEASLAGKPMPLPETPAPSIVSDYMEHLGTPTNPDPQYIKLSYTSVDAFAAPPPAATTSLPTWEDYQKELEELAVLAEQQSPTTVEPKRPILKLKKTTSAKKKATKKASAKKGAANASETL